MTDALLNPPVEAAACRRMIAHVREQLGARRALLHTSRLSHEAYLEAFARQQELAGLLKDLEQIYDREFSV